MGGSLHDSDDSWKNKPFRLLLLPSRAPGGWRGDSWRIISKVCGCKENDSVPKSTLKTIMAFCTCAQIHLSLLIMSCTISGACAFFTGEVTRTGRLVDWEAGARRWPVMQGLPWTPPLVTWLQEIRRNPTQCKPTQVWRTAKQSVVRPPACYSMSPPPQMVTNKCGETPVCRAAAGTRLSLTWHGGGLTRNKQPLDLWAGRTRRGRAVFWRLEIHLEFLWDEFWGHRRHFNYQRCFSSFWYLKLYDLQPNMSICKSWLHSYLFS